MDEGGTGATEKGGSGRGASVGKLEGKATASTTVRVWGWDGAAVGRVAADGAGRGSGSDGWSMERAVHASPEAVTTSAARDMGCLRFAGRGGCGSGCCNSARGRAAGEVGTERAEEACGTGCEVRAGEVEAWESEAAAVVGWGRGGAADGVATDGGGGGDGGSDD